jgi:hypothetical protein
VRVHNSGRYTARPLQKSRENPNVKVSEEELFERNTRDLEGWGSNPSAYFLTKEKAIFGWWLIMEFLVLTLGALKSCDISIDVTGALWLATITLPFGVVES